MALSFSQFYFSSSSSSSRLTSPNTNNPPTTIQIAPKPTTILTKYPPKFSQFASWSHKFTTIRRAAQEEDNNRTNGSTKNLPLETQKENSQSDEVADLGMEIKKAMKEREQKESGFFSGVVEEIREIEWPAFNKVLATTGVVLGIIAGSSVVLLTVNAVLAELSDGLFAGKGVQDFFG